MPSLRPDSFPLDMCSYDSEYEEDEEVASDSELAPLVGNGQCRWDSRIFPVPMVFGRWPTFAERLSCRIRTRPGTLIRNARSKTLERTNHFLSRGTRVFFLDFFPHLVNCEHSRKPRQLTSLHEI